MFGRYFNGSFMAGPLPFRPLSWPICGVSRQSTALVLIYAAALALGIVAVAPFVETHGQLILEPDMPVKDIQLYYDVLAGAALPPPAPNVYFEGHSLIYALVMRLVALVAGAPADVEMAAASTINVVNAIAHVLATVVFFAGARRLARNDVAALVLTALFALSPQIIDIDLVRIDRFMLLPLVVILHESLRITQGDPPHGAALGAALAVIAATKITGAAFALFPVTAFVILFARTDVVTRRQLVRAAATTVAVGAPLFAVLMIRFVLHPAIFIDGLRTSYGMQMSWTSVFAFTPRFYYNVDLFLTYGAVFLILVALSFALVAARSRRDPVCLWLILNLVIFSALGVAAFKYSRGGYHLVPLYLYGMAIAVRAAADYVPKHRPAVLAATVVALLIPTGVAARGFVQAAEIARQRPQSIAASRFAARDWIAAHFTPGARICMMGSSQWANPQLKGLGFHVTTQVFDFPYLDRATMAEFLPPRMDQLRAACDGIVFNDLHKTAYIGNFRTFGADARLKEWQMLLEDLERAFPPQVFMAKTPAYYVSRVEVYDLGVQAAPPDPAAGPAAHLTGAVDTAQRYGDKVSVQGWAADLQAHLAAGAIAIVTEGGTVVDGTATSRRPDVAEALKTPALQAAGFSSCVILPTATTLTVLARGVDGTWGRIGPEAVEIRDGQGAPPPWCQSQE